MTIKRHIRDEMLVVRVSAALKHALQLEAKAQNRSVGNLVEWLLLRGLEAGGGDRQVTQRRSGRGASGNLPRKRLSANEAHAARRRGRKKPSRQRKGT